MYAFAEVYGEWNDYWQNYTWKSLDVCCHYYGYFLEKAHNSLEDSKATLYCYNKLINDENRYTGKEYIGTTVKDFLSLYWIKINNRGIKLSIRPYKTKESSFEYYQMAEINKYDDLKYQELLDCKILDINYIEPLHFEIWVENILKGDYDILNKKYIRLKNEIDNLREDRNNILQRYHKKCDLYEL